MTGKYPDRTMRQGYGTCKTTGKRMHPDRKSARQQRRSVGDTTLSIYRCEHCDHFHVGHLPPDVRNGTFDRAEWKAQD